MPLIGSAAADLSLSESTADTIGWSLVLLEQAISIEPLCRSWSYGPGSGLPDHLLSHSSEGNLDAQREPGELAGIDECTELQRD